MYDVRMNVCMHECLYAYVYMYVCMYVCRSPCVYRTFVLISMLCCVGTKGSSRNFTDKFCAIFLNSRCAKQSFSENTNQKKRENSLKILGNVAHTCQ